MKLEQNPICFQMLSSRGGGERTEYEVVGGVGWVGVGGEFGGVVGRNYVWRG